MLCLSAALVRSADTATPSPATQPNGLSSASTLFDSLQQRLDAAKADAAKVRDEYMRLADAAIAKLDNNPDYKAAVAKVDAAKEQLEDARQSGSAEVSSYS